jgi:hypothetical protein
MYTEALSEVLSYTAGSAAASAIGKLIEREPDDQAVGVVERAELEDDHKGKISFGVAAVVALVLALSIFRGRS